MNTTLWYRRLLYITTLICLCVIVIGAWVRLTDAGLGCPDWPGCYGRLVLPADEAVRAELQEAFPERALDPGAAWREMIHRYLASILGLCIIGIAALAWLNRRRPGQPVKMPLALVALVIFQGILGMWTVTLLLKPLIVMAHLLGGLATLSLLFWLLLTERRRPPDGRWRRVAAAPAVAAIIVLLGQISLGGWTSTNYAALACPDLPTCMGQWWPEGMDFREGFIMWRGIGIDYEFGVLESDARLAIHFTHRLGGLITFLFLIGVACWYLLREPRRRQVGQAAGLVIAAVGLQVLIGLGVVWYGVPLTLAAAHNGFAALLLLATLNLYHAASRLPA
ncbi:MAG: COX15/CtaA family protein [Chromatiales bacterium]|nr:COX15/CtaA family protein [Chromatiales bacterium]